MFNLDESWLLIAAIYGGIILVAFWFALVLWTYRDMRARSRDSFAALIVGVMVAILNIPGIFVYILLRPRETLSEAYERSLEEEALLQEIEEKPSCPGCAQRVHSDWQACPYCHTRLKKLCINCKQVLDLSWDLCPYCTTSQVQAVSDDLGRGSRHVQRSAPKPPVVSDKWLNPTTTQGTASRSSDEPQYIDGDY